MNNLYNQHKAAFDEIAEAGGGSIAEMAKFFSHHGEMDAALGYSKAVKNWIDRRGAFSKSSNRRAGQWLAENARKAKEEPKATSGAVLMVIPPADKIESVQRMLAMIGCEVVEV